MHMRQAGRREDMQRSQSAVVDLQPAGGTYKQKLHAGMRITGLRQAHATRALVVNCMCADVHAGKRVERFIRGPV
jgi:hypothetical protein